MRERESESDPFRTLASIREFWSAAIAMPESQLRLAIAVSCCDSWCYVAAIEKANPRRLRVNSRCGANSSGRKSTPRRIRTFDLRIRSPLLYPAELWCLVSRVV